MTHTLRPFHPTDQPAVFELILAGLGQRFDDLKPEYNPDLYDIQASYINQGATVLVVEHQGAIIGCGALVKENRSDTVARIVRVSVRTDHQGKGLGRRISEQLLAVARERKFTTVLVETNSGWTSALRLYRSLGFTETHRVQSEDFDFIEVHMELSL